MELHVFDFDGTIFYSPSPNANVVRRLFGHDMVAQLMNVTHAGGLGWFQSLSSLSPPAVPADPDVQHWYVGHVLQQMRTIAAAHSASPSLSPLSSAADVTASPDTGVTASVTRASPCNMAMFVLSGRDAKYSGRIAHLLRHAGVYDNVVQVMLKPHETAGTVRHKLCAFLRLIRRYHPRHIYYYEDRPDQGRRILEAMRHLHRRLHPALVPHVDVRILRDDGVSGEGGAGGVLCRTNMARAQGVQTSDGTLHHDAHVRARGHCRECACGDATEYARAPCGGDAVLFTGATAAHASAGSAGAVPRTTQSSSSQPPWLRRLSPPLPVCQVLSDNNVAARRAERQAESLVDAALTEELQERRQQRLPHDKLSEGNEHASRAGHGGDEADVYNNADPPPFCFTLVMMPVHIRARSEQMLSEQQLAELVAQLQRERDNGRAVART